MKFVLIFSVLFAVAAARKVTPEYELEKEEHPENLKENAALKNFIKVVDANKMNVSIIISQGKNFKDNGNLKEAMAMAVTFPTNNEHLTKSDMTKEDGKRFIKTATAAKIPAKVTTTEGEEKYRAWSNKPDSVPVTQSHHYYTTIKNGQAGFVWDENNYAAQNTFITVGSDGKNQTTKVYYGNVDVKVVENHGISENDVPVFKKILAEAFFTFEDVDTPKAVVEMLQKKFPDNDWQAACGVGENNYVNANGKQITLKVLDYNFLIYSI